MKLEHVDGIALLRLDEGHANAIADAFLERLDAALDQVGAARALVLTGTGGVFSAGLDLPTLITLDRPAMEAFIARFGRTMRRLFALDQPVVAAVNGHAIAGGCVLMLLADWRVLAEGAHRVGLNESQLGIGLPAVAVEALREAVPASSQAPVALEGRLFDPAAALQHGLVHEVVPAARLLARAMERARELASVPAGAYAHIKRGLRGPALDRIAADVQRDAARWTTTWFSPAAQERLGAAVDRLQKK